MTGDELLNYDGGPVDPNDDDPPLADWERALVDPGGVFVAPAGTPPPVDGTEWTEIGTTDAATLITPAVVTDPDKRWLPPDPLGITRRSITVTGKITPVIAAILTGNSVRVGYVGAPDPDLLPFRGLDDNITGRDYPDDGLHPPSRLGWLRTVEGRDADGEPLVVCEHCGEPTPCTEEILRHMDTDLHHVLCAATGRCMVAGRPLEELPRR